MLGNLNILAGIGLVVANALFRGTAFRAATGRVLTRSSEPTRSGPDSLVVGGLAGMLAAAATKARRRLNDNR